MNKIGSVTPKRGDWRSWAERRHMTKMLIRKKYRYSPSQSARISSTLPADLRA